MDFDRPPVDPVAELKRWLKEAEAVGLSNPSAMTLATVDVDGKPSARMVLLKEIDKRGAVFYTNRASRKGQALEANPRAALVFYWDALGKQVVIEGDVTAVPDEESDAYFATRSRSSQMSAWASRQSEPVKDRATLEAAYATMERRFEGKEVPRPPHWGGYRMSLSRIEFWQTREHRLHDRIVYTPGARGGWRTQRMYP